MGMKCFTDRRDFYNTFISTEPNFVFLDKYASCIIAGKFSGICKMVDYFPIFNTVDPFSI